LSRYTNKMDLATKVLWTYAVEPAP